MALRVENQAAIPEFKRAIVGIRREPWYCVASTESSTSAISNHEPCLGVYMHFGQGLVTPSYSIGGGKKIQQFC